MLIDKKQLITYASISAFLTFIIYRIDRSYETTLENNVSYTKYLIIFVLFILILWFVLDTPFIKSILDNFGLMKGGGERIENASYKPPVQFIQNGSPKVVGGELKKIPKFKTDYIQRRI